MGAKSVRYRLRRVITLQNKGIPVISKYRDNEDSCILRIIKMVMPHKKEKEKESRELQKKIDAFVANGGTIKTDIDKLEGEYLRMHSYLEKALKRGRVITKTSICKGLRITPTKCTEMQRVLYERGVISMNAIGTVTAVS